MVDIRELRGTLHSGPSDPAPAYNGRGDSGDPAGRRELVRSVVVGDSSASDLSILVEPWLLTENDIPWLWDICKRRYDSRYDAISTELWFRNKVLKEPLLFLPQRMPNSFCISMLSVLPWLPSDFNCNVGFICAEEGCGWEAMKLLRSSREWARTRKCRTWALASDTPVDLKQLAWRLEATEIYPRYVYRFD
jgi:hypothetical protein